MLTPTHVLVTSQGGFELTAGPGESEITIIFFLLEHTHKYLVRWCRCERKRKSADFEKKKKICLSVCLHVVMYIRTYFCLCLSVFK